MLATMTGAIVVPAHAGALWNVLGTEIYCKVRSEETDGAYSIIDNIVPPLAGPPPHVHHNEDEVFYVTAGEFEIHCGDETFRAITGDLAVLPRDVPHCFRNLGATEGRLLVTITPGGFERFFEEVSQQIRTMPPNVEQVKAIGRKYNLEFLI